MSSSPRNSLAFPMSLPSLPTELIQQIIESSVPSTYHTSTYRERTSTIYALCLVSRRFRLIAQPILGEIVVLDWSAGVGCAMQSRIEEVKQWDAVRQVVVSLYNHDDMLKLVVASCPKVHELTINYHSAKDDFGLLSHLSGTLTSAIYPETIRLLTLPCFLQNSGTCISSPRANPSQGCNRSNPFEALLSVGIEEIG